MIENKKRLLIPGVALGILALILAVLLKPAPPVVSEHSNARLVDIVSLNKMTIAPKVTGFGRVSPKHIWQGVAQVSGKLTYRNPQLESGRLLPKGTLLLTIDPLEYQLKLAQAQANISATKAKLSRSTQEELNLKMSLEIEDQKLLLVDQEYQRKQTLKKRNLVSSSDVEGQKQALLVQRKLVQDLQSSLRLLPEDRLVTEAQLQVDIAQEQDAQRHLDNTRVILPYDARIAEVNIEVDQVVTTGEMMLAAHRLGKVEIKAELSLTDMSILMRSIGRVTTSDKLPNIERLSLQANIRLNASGLNFDWPGSVTRVSETVDPEQATVGVYVEVDQGVKQLKLPLKPPLTNGMFVSTTIEGAGSEQFVVTEKALHGDKIYLMTKENALKIVAVEVLFRRDEMVAVAGDIHQGDRLILNDLIPAVAGMALITPEQLTATAVENAK
ncbi:HlyD family secretion protein [Shewanella eurypsychrophilus]|uniref:HlyD family secretion protein n=1 Tax=Shewanella eurypsychrophilus TaxID=2593656 RepID=A0ABX6V9K0_9GAMM|nr:MULTISPECIES: HlyD family efflux transporter periplasmic adaptor subunit [Shewanella]QFU24128.1 HlyD family secretion protein [Shewanella sp. YLB-09]QPG59335.1 HlyD family secretion protein [Shewanella eurypsychrophilus]